MNRTKLFLKTIDGNDYQVVVKKIALNSLLCDFNRSLKVSEVAPEVSRSYLITDFAKES